MVFILSMEQDFSTSDVIDWLNFKDINYYRLNQESLLKTNLQINDDESILIIENDDNIDLRFFETFWYRRGFFNIPYEKIIINHESDCVNVLNNFNYDEKKDVQDLLNFYMSKKRITLNEYNQQFYNKLIILEEAKSFGIKIPETLITNKGIILKNFLFKHKNIITKAIKNGFNFKIDKTTFYLHTLLIEESDAENIPDLFSMSCFQKLIDKAFELRIFFIEETFYPSAVFSQNDEQTRVDVRNYNEDKPNRVVPFQLPIIEQNKLIQLMRKLKINCGSIDMMVSKRGEYIFLEVNAVGQFDQVSKPCNYYLEEKIAKYLSQ